MTVTVDSMGRPLLLLSDLAEHTANLHAHPEASLLLTEPLGAHDQPLALGRVTILGSCARVDDRERGRAREVFLKAQPSAVHYVDFGDFGFYRLEPNALRYVGGFGRMSWVNAEDYRAAAPDPLAAAASGILTRMNEDHAATLIDCALGLAGIVGATSVTMTAVDRYGFEIAAATPGGPSAARLAFEAEVTTPDEVRQSLVAMGKMSSRGPSTRH